MEVRVKALNAQIDALAYEAFGLTADEQAILEQNAPGEAA